MKLDQTESSFIIQAGSRAQMNQVQTALLEYCDDSKDQVERALSGKKPADNYDLRLHQEIIQASPGYKASRTTEQLYVFGLYGRCLVDFFELKYQSMHTDVAAMADRLAQIEATMADNESR